MKIIIILGSHQEILLFDVLSQQCSDSIIQVFGEFLVGVGVFDLLSSSTPSMLLVGFFKEGKTSRMVFSKKEEEAECFWWVF